MHRLQKLSVLIPVYNEEATVETLIRRVLAVELPKKIIVVDDASTDETATILSKLAGDPEVAGSVVFLKHESNQGKGAALRTALQRVEGDVVIIQDADLEYATPASTTGSWNQSWTGGRMLFMEAASWVSITRVIPPPPSPG